MFCVYQGWKPLQKLCGPVLIVCIFRYMWSVFFKVVRFDQVFTNYEVLAVPFMVQRLNQKKNFLWCIFFSKIKKIKKPLLDNDMGLVGISKWSNFSSQIKKVVFGSLVRFGLHTPGKQKDPSKLMIYDI